MPSQSTLIGAAGEHHVMSELLKRGYVAALAPQGSPNSDIVVTNVEGDKLCSIQVKSRRDNGSDGGWHMKAKHEKLSSQFLFYCFVDFGDIEAEFPATYIIPSEVVAELLATDHKAWLSTPGKNGHQKKDSQMRRLKADYSKTLGEDSRFTKGWLEAYRNAWHLLRLEE